MNQQAKEQYFKPDMVVDASSGVLGRIASFAAKQALIGKKIAIVNCNSALVTGNQRAAIREYKRMRSMGGKALRGPLFPKSPERLMKRTIRGMLSYKQERGRSALKRIFCFSGFPSEYASIKKISLAREITTKSIDLSSLGKEI